MTVRMGNHELYEWNELEFDRITGENLKQNCEKHCTEWFFVAAATATQNWLPSTYISTYGYFCVCLTRKKQLKRINVNSDRNNSTRLCCQCRLQENKTTRHFSTPLAKFSSVRNAPKSMQKPTHEVWRKKNLVNFSMRFQFKKKILSRSFARWHVHIDFG